MNVHEEILDGEDAPPPAALSPAASSPAPSPAPLISSPRHSKRPRATTGGRFRGSNNRDGNKHVRPTHYLSVINNPEGDPTCCFCGLHGRVRACEGRMLGPFHPPANSKDRNKPPIYCHRNCAVWAPEVYENANGQLENVYKVWARARNKKCFGCKSKGASLSCNFGKTKCCRPYHFRCGLVAGIALHSNFEIVCEKHKKMVVTEKLCGVQEKTPVAPHMLLVGCKHCESDTYDHLSKGLILTCSLCNSRSHSRCVVPGLEIDGMFALNSWNGKHYCKKCMRCAICEDPIDETVYEDYENGGGSSDTGDFLNGLLHGTEEQDPRETVLCIGCKHFGTHVGCLPEGVDKRRWRCDLCRTCRHCSTIDIPREEWNEKYNACAICFNEIQSGGVICPVCNKVYRENENVRMIQCDYCDSWIHSDVCANLSVKQFQDLGNPSKKYRCPICQKQKKEREVERKKGKGSRADSKAVIAAKAKVTVEATIRQIAKEGEDVTYHTVRPLSIAEEEGQVWRKLCDDLAIGLEICRHCCSGGLESSMQFCTDCGESFHPSCHEVRAGKSPVLPNSSGGIGVPKRGRYGKPQYVQAAYDWRCSRCEGYHNRTSEDNRMSIAAITNKTEPTANGTAPAAIETALTANGTTPSTSSTMLAANGTAPTTNGTMSVMNGVVPIANGVAIAMCEGDTLRGQVTRGWNNPTETAVAIDHVQANGQDQGEANGAPVLDLTGSSDDAISWQDKRVCELCQRREFRSLGPAGRLVPWACSTSLNFSQVWVHFACLLCSNGVTRNSSRTGFDTLLASRRLLLNQAKRTTCSFCGLPGATLVCAHEKGCGIAYHFDCAKEAKASCLVDIARQPALPERVMQADEDDMLNLGDMDNLRILCPKHASCHPTRNLLSVEDCVMRIRLGRLLRVLDSQGFSPNSEPPRKKPLSIDRTISLRVGSLAVIRFGELVPEVNDFIVQGCLVPLGYCAARRYWSIMSKGRRCTYLLEVRGTRLSGPKFVIRCFDEPSFRIEDKDPEEAWLQVIRRLGRLVDKNLMESLHRPSHQRLGLEAFGLSNCAPVVSHIETMPMASLFKGRYDMKFQATLRSNAMVFYNSLVKNYKPPIPRQNHSGSARSEGYLPRSLIEKRRKRYGYGKLVPPHYENARTGLEFQLEVAREVLSGKKRRKELPEHRCFVGEKVEKKGCNGRPRRRSAPEEVKPGRPKKRVRTKFPNAVVVPPPPCLAPNAKERTRILRSDIDGWGVFATTDIPANELIIEYVGEIIRPPISDLREKQYTDMGIGCYMFEIVQGRIVDATMCGNAARYINHSCAPNCFSKTIRGAGTDNVVAIYSKRKIQRGEELSYDYQFPFDESDRVTCGCGAEQCKGFMN